MARRKAPPKSQRRSRAGSGSKRRPTSTLKSRSKSRARATTRSRSTKRASPGAKRAPAAKRAAPAPKARHTSVVRRIARKAPPKAKPAPKAAVAVKSPTANKKAARRSPGRLSRERRILDEGEPLVPTPPSSLDMNRKGSAVRSGRAEMAHDQAQHASFTPSINAGDVDVNVEDAYFSGDEAPGGDNPTPDQEVVDEIGRALGVEYQDAEELRSGDKIANRDKHRWELDPASSEDYKERKK